MLTKKEIREKLRQNPEWEPGADATIEEWDLYDAVLEELDSGGKSPDDGDEDENENGNGDRLDSEEGGNDWD